MTKPKLWTKDFLIISSTNFFIFLTFYLLMVTLTVFSVKQFDSSPSMAGLTSSIFVLGAVLVRPLTGKSIEQIGRKKMLYGSLIVFLISTLLYFEASTLSFLLIIRLIHGMSFGVASTATGTIVADIIPGSRRGEGMGYFAMSTNLAMAIGPFIGLFLSTHFTYHMVFLIASIFAAFAFLATIFLHVPVAKLTKEQLDSMKGYKLRDLFEFAALPIAILSGIVGLTYSSILSFLTSYSQEIDMVSAASFFFVMYAVFLLITRPFTGQWFDLKGENFVIYPSLILYTVGLVILSQVNHSFLLLIAGALIGIGLGTYQSSAQTIALKLSPPHRVGLATSTFFVMYDLGIGTGPFLLGYYIPVVGYRGLYLTMAVIAFICIGIYYYIHGRKAKVVKQQQL